MLDDGTTAVTHVPMESNTTAQTVTAESQVDDGEGSDILGFDFDAFDVISDVAKHLGRANDFFVSRGDWYRNRYVSPRCVPHYLALSKAPEICCLMGPVLVFPCCTTISKR